MDFYHSGHLSAGTAREAERRPRSWLTCCRERLQPWVIIYISASIIWHAGQGVREGERLRNKTDTVSITVGSADFLFQKKKQQSNDDENGFFFFLLSLLENGFAFRPLTLKKKIYPPFEEFNYGVLDLFIVGSGRIGPRAGDERRDRVISLPPACERGSRTSPKGKNTAALIRSSASCTLEVALPRADSDRPRLGLGRGATQSEIKLYSVSMRPGLKARGRETQQRF